MFFFKSFPSSALPIKAVRTDFSILDSSWMRIVRLFLHFSSLFDIFSCYCIFFFFFEPVRMVWTSNDGYIRQNKDMISKNVSQKT